MSAVAALSACGGETNATAPAAGASGSGGESGASAASGMAGTSDTGGTAGTGGGSGPPPATPPSCEDLPASCGANGDDDCCASIVVPGGKFIFGRRPGDSDDTPCGAGTLSCGTDEAGVSASVSSFSLDKYEVTVGRFRNFVRAFTAGWRPAAGSGKHVHLDGGAGLAGEAGWESSWWLPSDWDQSLACDAPYSTWTPLPGENEARPINCISWYEAYAFCIWDGGFLPTEAEWEYAASGGEERVFPWSTPPSDATADATHACHLSCNATIQVGSKPTGNGRWGHADLAGNVWEWTLDWYAETYADPCDDCAEVRGAYDRTMRGGYYSGEVRFLRAAFRGPSPPVVFGGAKGARCARAVSVQNEKGS
jgi:formylglycine-generating enzyme required for sulfatase activity